MMPTQKKVKKIALLPNAITAFGLICGLFAIFKMNMTGVGEANLQVLTFTTALLLVAAFADVLDGAVARAMKAESDFGGVFDCLADAISFGLAPSVIVLKSLSLSPGSELSILITAAAMVYSMCGVLRLVRFNISDMLAKENPQMALAYKKHFTGLPIPAAAAAAISINLFLISGEFKHYFAISEEARAWLLIASMTLLGFLMISRWKFPSVKTLRFRVASFQAIFITTLCAIALFYSILSHFALVLFAISWSYIAIALSLSLIRLVTGKRLKKLEEFEPEPDDLEEEDE